MNKSRQKVKSNIYRVNIKNGGQYFQNVYLFITKGESADLKKLSREDIESKKPPDLLAHILFAPIKTYDKIELPDDVPYHCAH